MKVNRQELIKALETVAPALGSSGAPIDTQSIKFWDGLIQSSNGLVRIQTKLPVDFGFRISVPGDPLIALLKSLKTDEVELNLGKDGKFLAVRTVKVDGKFNAIKVEDFHLIDFSMYKTITDKDQCKSIIEGLAMCRNNVSKDDNAGPLKGIRIEGNEVLSTNRSRIYRYKLKSDTGWHCTVYKTFVDVVVSHTDSVETICMMADEALGVIIGSTYIQTKLISGTYPNLDQYFPNQKSVEASRIITYLDPIGDSLGRHIDFLSGVDNAEKEVSITIAGLTCEVVSKNESVGELREVVDLKEKVDTEISFLINPILLKDFLTRCNYFRYLLDSRLVLFEILGVEHLVQTRE